MNNRQSRYTGNFDRKHKVITTHLLINIINIYINLMHAMRISSFNISAIL